MILQREGDREQALWCLFHKGLNPILGGPTLMTSSNPNYFPKTSPPNTTVLGVEFQHMKVGVGDGGLRIGGSLIEKVTFELKFER